MSSDLLRSVDAKQHLACSPHPRSRWRADLWRVGVVAVDPGELVVPGVEAPVRWFDNPEPGTFLADPFPLDDESLLCEEFHFATASTRIVRVWPRSNGVLGREVVLDAGAHLSYPFVVREGGRVSVIPEQSAGGELRRYLWDGRRLIPDVVLVPGFAALDATFGGNDEQGWWLVCSTSAGSLWGNDLEMWRAPALAGPWERHARHSTPPVSRPAGGLFQVGGTWYRPAQDNRGSYGAALLMHRFDVESAIDEPAVALVLDSPAGLIGPHTLNAWGDGRSVIDAKRVVLSPSALIGRVARRLRSAPNRPLAAALGGDSRDSLRGVR